VSVARAFSAGIIVARAATSAPRDISSTPHAWRYLIVRCFRNWDFPKGEVEAGESPLAAALRETEEETSLTQFDFPWGEVFSETAPYGARPGKIARYYLARWRTGEVFLPIAPELGKPENDEFRWASADEAQALLPARLQPVFVWARGFVEQNV
jgi:8-oxo-dGTP pyrophosphatase MutT (NUDIX family)